MSRQPPRGPPKSLPTKPGFRYVNPTPTQQQRGLYRADSRDSGIASSGYQAGPSGQQQQQSTSASVVNDFDWADDDDDMDIVMASQQVEEAVGQRGDNVPSTSRRLQSSPNGTRDAAMTLEMHRFELALKESRNNGEDARMDFMRDGFLGGDISADKEGKKELLDKVKKLEDLNAELRRETYASKGEATNLRKLVEKQKKEKQLELINRQKREHEIREREAKFKKEMTSKEESLQTELKFKRGELRSALEKHEALKKLCRKFQEAEHSPVSQMSSSAVPKFDMGITKTLPSTQSTSSGFNLSKSSFYKSEVTTSPANSASLALGSPASIATIQLSPKKSVITASAEVQTEDLLTEKPSETAFKLWMGDQTLRQERLQNSIEQISVMATSDFQFILPKLTKISQSAETKLVRELNLEGYRYELFFPGNLKIAEFKMDLDKETKPKSKLRFSKFPSQCEDWRGVDAFETTVNQILFSQRDIWATMCYVLNDIVRRINCMRRKRRNSVYRANNCLHMFKLMSWAANLWYNFRQEFWLLGNRDDMENGIYEEIRQWTAAMLWIGNHYFGVLDFQVCIRPFVLRTLINMERNGIFHCTYANYLRLYYLIYHTLTIDRHATAENLNLCLQLARAVDRKKFVIDFMCRGRNDGTCLAYLFGTKTMELFLKERDPERRFRIYENYLKLLATIRQWCCVHVSGEEQCEDDVQKEDVDDTDVNPVFVTKEKLTARPTDARSNSGRFHSTIKSFYGSEEITIDDDDGDVDDNSTQPIDREPARKKQRLDSKSDSSGTASTNIAVRGTSSETATQIMEENILSEVSEDEYDEVQAEAKELLENVRERNQQPAEAFCRNFLDCSQWEEYKNGPKVGSCQCRHHLMETFMRMTEEVIHIWRHVKTNFEFQKLSNEATKSESETLQTEVDELMRVLDEEERTEVKSNAEMDQDLQLSKENPFWKRIIQDGNMVKPALRPDEISNKMNLIVAIIDETYFTTQHNTKQAFGSEGTNAFHAVIAYLLQFLKAFNLSKYNRERICKIASESFIHVNKTGSGSEQLIRTLDQKLLEEIPSGYEDFDTPVVPFTKFPRDLQDENIRACLPHSVLQSIDELEERISAPKLQDSSMNQADEAVMEVDQYEQSRRHTRDSLNTSGDLFTQSTSKRNGKKDDADEDSCESASESEDVNDEDSGWETVDSDDEGDEKKFVKVQDYNKFGGPALEEQPEFFEEPPRKFEVTHKQLLAAFKKGPKIKYDNLVKFKSARTACEELKKTGSVSSGVTGPSQNDCVECSKDMENSIQKLMSRMNVQDYYKDRNPLWNDYKDRSHPVNI